MPLFQLEGPELNSATYRIRQKLVRAFFQAQTRLKDRNLAVFVQNMNWISKKILGASIGLSSKHSIGQFCQARACPGSSLIAWAWLRLEKMGSFHLYTKLLDSSNKQKKIESKVA